MTQQFYSQIVSQTIKNGHSNKYLHTNVHSGTIHNSYISGHNPNIHQWMNTWNIIQPYKGIKHSQYATIWVKLENTMFGGRSQKQNVTYYMILLYEISRIGKSIETGNRLAVARGWEQRYGSDCLTGTKCLFWVMKMLRNLTELMAAQNYECIKCH